MQSYLKREEEGGHQKFHIWYARSYSYVVVSLTNYFKSKYNDLMTQSDKDFITRIQVSQLVTQDPYTEDFYAQVYAAVLRSRLGSSLGNDDNVLHFGGGGGVGLGLPGQRGAGRRETAMQRMKSQVERIVSNAKSPEGDKTKAELRRSCVAHSKSNSSH